MVRPLKESVKGACTCSLNIRVWKAGRPTLFMLHGVVSHAAWLDPIASRLSELGVTVVCPDRRGAGDNQENRGDAPSGDALLKDLELIISHYTSDAPAAHLCGFCWGAGYAINYILRYPGRIRSLILLVPSVFPSEILPLNHIVLGDSGVPTEDPFIPLDAFTKGIALEDYIVPDPIRTRFVSPRFNAIMMSFSQMIGAKLLKVHIPTLMVLAESDRITDNQQAQRVFDRLPIAVKRLEHVPGEHGVQFDAPDEVTRILHTWLIHYAS